MIENIEPVNAPSCYRISLLSSSLEVTARLKSVDDLDLLMNVLESNRAFFVKNDRLAAEVLTLTQESRDSTPSPGMRRRHSPGYLRPRSFAQSIYQ